MLTQSHMFQKEFFVNSRESIDCVITAQIMSKDINGNRRYFLQIWSLENGQLQTPKVNGYRRTKNNGYIIRSTHIYEDIKHFQKCVQESIWDDTEDIHEIYARENFMEREYNL